MSARALAALLLLIALLPFAGLVAAMILAPQAFARPLAGLPLGIWLAIGTMASAFAVVLLHARVMPRR